MAESEDKGYTVKDRRYLHMSEEEKAKAMEEEQARKAAGASQGTPKEEAPKAAREVPLPEITFSAFLLSLSSSAFAALGDIPEPAAAETRKNLPLAKQTIDLLGMLREKTRNNLDPEEESLFDHLLYDLRMRFLKEMR
jgi:hypothetical protein